MVSARFPNDQTSKGIKMTTHMNNAKLGLLLPAFLNPAVAAALGIGIIAVGLYRLLPDDDEEETVDDVPSDDPKAALPAVRQPVPTVEVNEVQQVAVPSNEPLQTVPAATDEADESEIIRKAMSELGKRSAAARARKKAEPGQVP
jgi:hypothetical protein